VFLLCEIVLVLYSTYNDGSLVLTTSLTRAQVRSPVSHLTRRNRSFWRHNTGSWLYR